MNNIKINDEIYGTSMASEVMYDGGVSGLEATNTQDAIDELAYSIKSGESDTMAREVLASTLTQLGVPTSSDASFVTINENIMILAEQKYDEGNEDGIAACMIGDATVGDVLSGKIFTNSSDAGLTGTMPNQGAKTSSLNCGESYTIPAGYHNGNGKITANSLASQTSANAVAANITKGKTAWVNGVKITGTRPAPTTSQKGSVVMCNELSGQKSVTKTITFPSSFDTIPVVSATASSTVSQAHATLKLSITSITRIGFTATVTNGQASNGYNAQTVTLSWIATAESA